MWDALKYFKLVKCKVHQMEGIKMGQDFKIFWYIFSTIIETEDTKQAN